MFYLHIHISSSSISIPREEMRAKKLFYCSFFDYEKIVRTWVGSLLLDGYLRRSGRSGVRWRKDQCRRDSTV